MDQLSPKWEPGDKWTIETSSLLLQTRDEPSQIGRSRTIRWQFAVQQYEKVISDDCYRIEVRCLLPGPPQPVTVLWVDKASKTIRQIAMQVPVRGGFKTITQNYDFPNGQRSPVLGPLTALPLDLPLFRGGQAKGLEKFGYTVNSGEAGATKALGDVGFSYDVEQDVQPVDASAVKGMVGESHTKALEQKPVAQVTLKQVDRQVKQLWQPGAPWPVYSDNGRTVARLISTVDKSGTHQWSESTP